MSIARCPHCGTDFTPGHLAARIEVLEAALLDAATRIEALNPAIHKSIDDWRERGERIEALEVALQAVLETFRKDEAQGYRSRDRQFAINILGKALAPEQEKP